MAKVQQGERIRALREGKHLTRRQLSERTGLSEGYLYQIETGRRQVSVNALCKLAEVLSASCDYILLGREPQPEAGCEAAILQSLNSMSSEQRGRVREMLGLFSDVADLIWGKQGHG